MFAFRTSTSLSAFGLLIGIAGTSWLTALTYERAPATRRLAEVVMPGSAPAFMPKTVSDRPMTATPPERLRTRAVVDLAAESAMHRAAAAKVARPAAMASDAAPAAPKAEPLVPVYMPSPRYPMEALRAHREGQVVLSVTVTPDGDVTAVSVGRSSGDPSLDDAAEEAVRNWRFAAADRAPRYTSDLPIRFELTDPL
ncbi:energy transducer TonB [Luteibacter aegosomatissinici]|uniref:energy transducer TonB n=1 Tax=Luteibacter aegosomatissinici TaxID=2911539 RepID=UPI001FF8DC7D|nr:energy transducer TonB [Luteibacter aegosomatissinici]UPG94289.1 energy transducer TonB [Luteibacter aegosomatissinici]